MKKDKILFILAMLAFGLIFGVALAGSFFEWLAFWEARQQW